MKQTQTGLLEHSKYFSAFVWFHFLTCISLFKFSTSLLINLMYEKCSGYVPPEYVRKGIYSMKYDVYSFGILLLQIISGKRNACYYGPNETLSLLDYVSMFIQLSYDLNNCL
jgi:serine/threonine protein kinase